MKIVSLIPARGGSKGIPNKNLIKILGKPLIQYALETSFKSRVNETWVSSDSKKILNFSSKQGAKVINRPKNISGDKASSEQALLHFSKLIDYDIIVFIQCTSPLINFKDVNKGIHKMKKYDSIVSVSETSQYFWNSDGPLYDLNKRNRRQVDKKRFLETGGIFITTRENLLKTKNRLSGKIGYLQIPKKRSFDIDSYEDLELVKLLIKSGVNRK